MFNKTTVIGTILIGGLVGLIVSESYEQGQRDLGKKLIEAIKTFEEDMKETEQEEA